FARQQDSPRRFALLVGINQYDNRLLENLQFAERDVQALAEILKRGYEVRLLLGSASRDSQQAATKASLERAIKKLVDLQLRKTDTVLVALAGHGEQIAVRKDTGPSQDEPFFLPKDAVPGEPASMLNLSDLIEKLGVRGGGTNLLLIDVCRNDSDPTRGRGI